MVPAGLFSLAGVRACALLPVDVLPWCCGRTALAVA